MDIKLIFLFTLILTACASLDTPLTIAASKDRCLSVRYARSYVREKNVRISRIRPF
jgi:hypothetical protein